MCDSVFQILTQANERLWKLSLSRTLNISLRTNAWRAKFGSVKLEAALIANVAVPSMSKIAKKYRKTTLIADPFL
ncbi:hypothetical protein FACS189449_12360 [Alphaproteobacteria bacterium]|nr:hypothetical protein FACS189449_12360 [Alphaproteobacteria bacterium]